MEEEGLLFLELNMQNLEGILDINEILQENSNSMTDGILILERNAQTAQRISSRY